LSDRNTRPGWSRRLFVALALGIGVCLFALPLVLADWHELKRTAANVDPALLAVPLVLSFLSYAAMSRSYQGIADAAGCRLPFGRWLRITYVSNTVNYLVVSAGLSGFAVRMYLLSQRGVARGRAVIISLVQTLLTNLTLLAFILGGFITLALREDLSRAALIAASLAVFAFTAVLTLAVVLVYHRRLRRRTLLRLANLAHRVLHRFVPRWAPRRVGLWRFQHNLNEGFEFLLSRKEGMLGPAAWIMLDWVLTIGILWSAFRAVHHPVGLGVVAVGFAVGIFLSLVSFVPGGLGIMETSMAAVFVSLKVPLESAVVAVVIFRVTYYWIPMLLSIIFFHGALAQARRGVAGSPAEV
jgi:uncharacterized protein (TIRG00374 family)